MLQISSFIWHKQSYEHGYQLFEPFKSQNNPDLFVLKDQIGPVLFPVNFTRWTPVTYPTASNSKVKGTQSCVSSTQISISLTIPELNTKIPISLLSTEEPRRRPWGQETHTHWMHFLNIWAAMGHRRHHGKKIKADSLEVRAIRLQLLSGKVSASNMCTFSRCNSGQGRIRA